MNIGDKVKALYPITSQKTFIPLPMDKIFSVIGVKETHPRLQNLGLGDFVIKIDFEPENWYFANSFVLINSVGFIIE